MRVLAIDTSTEALSVALRNDQSTIERSLETARGHAEQILSLIDAVLGEAGVQLVPVTSLEALAFPVIESGADRVIACLDARMGEVYWGCFAADPARGLTPLGPLQVTAAGRVSLPSADGYRGVGRGFAAYPELAVLAGVEADERAMAALPNAADMARLGALRLAAGEGVDPADIKPEYVRDKVALTEEERRAARGRTAKGGP